MSTMKIPLTKGLFAIIDEEDYPLVAKYKWHANVMKHTTYAGGYAKRTTAIKGRQKKQHMHRLILGAKGKECVDHINGDGLDNRRCNLRIATRSQNNMNKRMKRAPYKGVLQKTEVCWYACIKVNRKSTTLGYFHDPVDAALAYDFAALKLHGEFAQTNFPRKILEMIQERKA